MNFKHIKNLLNIGHDMEAIKKALAWLIVIVVLMFAFSICPVCPKLGELSEKLFISIFQFLLIVLIGGIASMMLKSYQSETKRQIKYRNELSEVSNQLVKHYNETKKIRRLLRAKALRIHDDKSVLLIEEYNALMEQLNLVQLEFEEFERRIKSEPVLFKNTQGLKANIHEISNYLSKIISEYETSQLTVLDTKKQTYLNLEGLKRVREFTEKRSNKKSDIDEKLFNKFKLAMKVLRSEINDTKLPINPIEQSEWNEITRSRSAYEELGDYHDLLCDDYPDHEVIRKEIINSDVQNPHEASMGYLRKDSEIKGVVGNLPV